MLDRGDSYLVGEGNAFCIGGQRREIDQILWKMPLDPRTEPAGHFLHLVRGHPNWYYIMSIDLIKWNTLGSSV